MVRCRAKGENYSYDFAASLQNTNEQSILISEKDLTAWKGAAERMLTNEIVLKVFSDYLCFKFLKFYPPGRLPQRGGSRYNREKCGAP